MACGIPVAVIQKVRVGLQQGYANGLWNILASVVSLTSLLVAVGLRAQLPTLVFCLVGVPVVVGVLHTLVFFFGQGRRYRPTISISRESLATVSQMGVQYFLLQVIAAFAVSADNMIIAATKGAASVGDYAIAAKLFSLPGMAIALLLQPLWPAYSEADARGDSRWVARTFKNVLGLSIAISICAGVTLIFTHQQIAELWLHRSLDVPIEIALVMALWACVDAISMNLATLLNSRGILKPQIVAGFMCASASFFVKTLLIGECGSIVLPLSASAFALAFYIAPMAVILFRVPRRSSLA